MKKFLQNSYLNGLNNKPGSLNIYKKNQGTFTIIKENLKFTLYDQQSQVFFTKKDPI